LRIAIIVAVGTFHFDPDRKVITTLSAVEIRRARVPGTVMGGDELQQLAVASNQKVCGNPKPSELRKVRVSVAIEPIREKILDVVPTKLAGRQADVMHHQQANLGAFRARIEIAALSAPRLAAPASVVNGVA
jgi:hypothetical protein